MYKHPMMPRPGIGSMRRREMFDPLMHYPYIPGKVGLPELRFFIPRGIALDTRYNVDIMKISPLILMKIDMWKHLIGAMPGD